MMFAMSILQKILPFSSRQSPIMRPGLITQLTALKKLISNSVVQPRNTNAVVQPARTSIAQRLPGEIVELILEYYVLLSISSSKTPPFHYDGHEDSRDHFRWSRGFQTMYHIQRQLVAFRDSRQSLRNGILVCRSWYLVGLQHLYMHPMILSHQRAAKLNNVLEEHPRWRTAKDLTLVYDEGMYKRPETFLSILNHSTSLDTLTVIQQHRLDISPFDRHLSVMENLTTRLRVLTLYGGHDWSKVLKLSFPELEHLRLQYLSANDRDILSGEMPKLQTLQLSQVKFKFSFEFFFRIGDLPSLHTLELYLTDYKRLRRFSVYSANMLSNIQHLVVGVLDGISSIDFGLWIPPPNLVSFTILVNLTPQKCKDDYRRGLVPDEEKNGVIRTMERLTLLLADLPRCSFLERFTIVTQLKFRGAGGGAVENARQDYNEFFGGGRSKVIEQAVDDYTTMLAHAKRRLKIPTQAVWCDLATFINHRLSQPPGAPEKPYELRHLGAQNIKRTFGNRCIEFTQEHVTPLF